MNIRVRDDAKERLLRIIEEKKGVIQLAYDAEGCGCAVSGVPSLWLIDPPNTEHFENAGDEQLPIFYEKRQSVFFEPNMNLSFNEHQNGFKLSSNQQIYNNAMSITDKRQNRTT